MSSFQSCIDSCGSGNISGANIASTNTAPMANGSIANSRILSKYFIPHLYPE